ncbi:hypothetical protein D3C80_1366160 [compost metagenome]
MKSWPTPVHPTLRPPKNRSPRRTPGSSSLAASPAHEALTGSRRPPGCAVKGLRFHIQPRQSLKISGIARRSSQTTRRTSDIPHPSPSRRKGGLARPANRSGGGSGENGGLVEPLALHRARRAREHPAEGGDGSGGGFRSEGGSARTRANLGVSSSPKGGRPHFNQDAAGA